MHEGWRGPSAEQGGTGEKKKRVEHPRGGFRERKQKKKFAVLPFEDMLFEVRDDAESRLVIPCRLSADEAAAGSTLEPAFLPKDGCEKENEGGCSRPVRDGSGRRVEPLVNPGRVHVLSVPASGQVVQSKSKGRVGRRHDKENDQPRNSAVDSGLGERVVAAT